MDKKMVALDIDGTLVDERGKLTPRTAETVRQVKGLGIKVVLATGRRFVSCRDIIDELEIDLPVVTHNGALVLSPCGKDVLNSIPLDKRWLPRMVREMEEQDIDYYLHSLDNILFCREPKMEWGEKHLKANEDLVERFNISSFPDRPFHRIMAVGSYEEIHSFLQKGIENQNGYSRHIFFRSEYNKMDIVELLHPKATKASGLKFVAKNLGINPEEIVAVGDETNDLEMVEWAGLGVAMGNGVAQLKKVADLVCGSNDEEGLADLLEEIFI